MAKVVCACVVGGVGVERFYDRTQSHVECLLSYWCLYCVVFCWLKSVITSLCSCSHMNKQEDNCFLNRLASDTIQISEIIYLMKWMIISDSFLVLPGVRVRRK